MPGPIPLLTNIPSIDDPTNFETEANDLLSNQLPAVINAMNSVATAMNMNSTSDTSSSSVLIGTGDKAFTVTAGKSFLKGMWLVAADDAAPSTNSMWGQVKSYVGTTLTITVPASGVFGSGTKASWVISQSAATLNYDDSVTLTGALNLNRATVASAATTAAIWAALGNDINYTGVVTTTGFPAAPQAGAERNLILAAAAPFTAGANMLIDGVASGSTIILAANDIVTVKAITTTQFRLTIKKYDGTAVNTKVEITGSFKGLVIANNGATPNSKMDVAIAEATLKDTNGNAILVSGVSVTIDITVTGANGIDTGAEAASTPYYPWVIYNPTTGATAGLLSVSPTAPTVPSGYPYKAQIGAPIYNNASSNFVTFRQTNYVVKVKELTTSGTAVDFFALPQADFKADLVGVSTNGTSVPIFQTGDSGGFENSTYLDTGSSASAGAAANFTTGFGVASSWAGSVVGHGEATFTLTDNAANTFVCSVSGGRSDSGITMNGGGSKSTSATFDRLRFTMVNGTDLFDAGYLTVTYQYIP